MAQRILLGLLYGAAVVVLTAPAVTESTLESLRFEDRLGTIPVEVGLAHNGYSVIDTGALGSIYLDRTGPFGLGLALRVTGPPTAGPTLSSYVDPAFVRANTATLTDPSRTADAYRGKLGDRFVDGFALRALLVGAVGGFVALRIVHPWLRRGTRRRRLLLGGASAAGLLAASSGIAAWQLETWSHSDAPEELYPLQQVAGLSFDTPQIREVAQQVQPFIDKNVARLKRRAEDYQEQAALSLRLGIPASERQLRPRSGERIVLAEADPQGSRVGTRVREVLYDELRSALGEEAMAARTISGDITSNGTVAESRFVEDEVAAAADLPVVAVKGDHDSTVTVAQLAATEAKVPDREIVEQAGLRFTGGADPEFKSLFGGSVENPSGVTPTERGAEVRRIVEEEALDTAVHALVHQNDAALGYLGLDDMADLQALPGPEGPDGYTEPREDGLPDLPPGSVTYGHWHESDGPWVAWNTDGEDLTWTLVDQVGTSGGVEEEPTVNRFSTPYSPPLKPIELRLHYVDVESGLVTGFVSIDLSLSGDLTISRRTDVGVPRSR